MIDAPNDSGADSRTYTARVSEACLAVHGCAWLSPSDPGVIAQLVLDAEAGPDRRPVIPDPGGMGTVRLARAPVIRTGIATGPVNVTMTTHGSAPLMDPVGLEDGAEFSIFAANQPAFVGGFGDRALPGSSIDFSGRGWYRLRVRASGRAVARDLVVPEACESYRIDVWRADHAEPVALTHSATEPAAVRARLQADLRRWAAQGSEQIAEFLNRSHHAPGPRLSAEDQAALERGQDRLRALAERRRRREDD